MKIVKKEMLVNDETFQPEIEVTMRFPIEAINETKILSEDDENNLTEILGKQIVKMIRKAEFDNHGSE
jgi:hypothetical protein